tara:strand:+ start:574 stop:1029 length:456 start_codon:yes stop_codon:yes gene_type:complete
MNKRKKDDIIYGLKCEDIFLSKFKNYNKNSRFDVIDFTHKNKNRIIELKSRKYNFNDCPDWKIGLNKINEGHNYCKSGGEFYVYMMFFDGLYYWKYKRNKVLQKNIKLGERVDRGLLEKQLYLHINLLDFKKSKYNISCPKIPELFPDCIF